MSARSKRATKPTTRREEDEDSDDVLYDPKKDAQPQKHVFRLLDNSDVSRSLVGAQVFVLWPDDGTWYRGRVKKCNPKEMTAFIYYEDTEEKETANLEELIGEGQIAFKEERPLNHACGPNEIEQGQEYFGKQRDGGPAAEDSDEDQAEGVADHEEDQQAEEFEEDDDMHDAGAVEDEEDSDFQLSDEEEKKASSSRRKKEKESQSHRARKRGRGSGSPESQGSDEDEDDDDVPLGKRLTPTERAAQRRRHVMAKRAAAGMRNQIGGEDLENGEEEDEEDDAAVERLLAQASGGAAASGSGGAQGRASARQPQRFSAAAAATKGGKKSGGGGGSNSMHDADIRAKVRSAFQQALDTALEEITAKDANAKLPKPSVVASAVEDALVRLFGGTTKEYRSKMRTLHFNLKDSHNPDLRAAVLRGDIPPDTFVRMTATELASKELAEYRKRKEEEALKMSVLDAEAAAKFSTAAALDARDRLALPADVVGGKLLAARDGDSIPDKDGDADTQAGKSTTTKGSDHPSLATQDAQPVEGAENDAFTHQAGSPRASLGGVSGGGRGATALTKSDSGEASAPATARATTAAAAAKVDWASIKAQAVQAGPGDAGEELPTLNLPTTESMLGSHITLSSSSKAGTEGNELGLSRDDDHAMGQGAFPPEHEAEKQDDRGRGGGVGGDAFDAQKQEHHHHHRQQQQQQQQHHFQNASEGLARILRPCPDRAVLSNAVWESELDVPGTGRFYVVADALAGSGDLAAMLGEAELVVKGRLAIDKVDHFLSELHLSKHRTVTLGIVRPAASATAAEREGLIGLAKQYQERGRTGVIEPGSGIEVYLIPPGHLSTRLLAAAAAVEPEAATDAARAGLDPGSFVAAAIHKLEMRAIPGAHRRIKRPRKPPQVVPLPAVPSAAGAAHALPPVPQLPDLSGLQALLAQTQAPTVHHQQLPSSTVPMVVPAQPSPSPQPPQPSAHLDLPAGLDLNAISALAAAFGVAAAAPQQPAPSPPAPSRPEPRQSRWEQPPTSIQQQLPPPSGSYQPPGFTLPASTAGPSSSHPRPMSHMAEPAPGSTITRPMVNDHASGRGGGGYHPGGGVGGGSGGAPPSARPMRYHAEGYGGGEDREGAGHSRPARGGGGGRHGSPMRPPYRRGGGGRFRGGARRGGRGG